MKKMKKIILSLYFVILINPAFSNVLIKMEDKIVINEQSWDQLGLSEEQKKQVLKIQKVLFYQVYTNAMEILKEEI